MCNACKYVLRFFKQKCFHDILNNFFLFLMTFNIIYMTQIVSHIYIKNYLV